MLTDFNFEKIWKHPNRPPQAQAAFTCTTVSRPRVKTQLVRTDHKWVLSSQMTDVMTDVMTDDWRDDRWLTWWQMTDVMTDDWRDDRWLMWWLHDWCEGKRGPSSIKWILEPFQRRRWGNFWETGWSTYGLVRAPRYRPELWGQTIDMMTSDRQRLYNYVRTNDWYDDILLIDQLRILSLMSDNTGV